MIRAMSRRTCRTRAVFSSCPLAFWKRRLNASLRRSPSCWRSSSPVLARTSAAFISRSLAQTRNETGLDRQLRRAEFERLARQLLRHAVELDNHPARLDPADPELRRALALTPADLGRLAGHRHEIGSAPGRDRGR